MPLDFSGQILRGRSFKGQNLEGANFSHADIKSTDFTGANLSGANFSHAKAGLQRRWLIILNLISLILSVILGIIAGLGGYLINLILNNPSLSEYNIFFRFLGYLLLLITVFKLFLFRILEIVKKLNNIGRVRSSGDRVISSITLGKPGISLIETENFESEAYSNPGAFAIFISSFLIIIFTGGLTFAFAVGGFIVFALAFVLSLIVSIGFNIIYSGDFFASLFILLVSTYISLQAINKDKNYTLLIKTTIAFLAINGTSFQGANLTDADFAYATLESTDFRRAILIRTRWHKVKNLDRVRPGNTYLQNIQLQQWLVNKRGKIFNFVRHNLQGIYLKNANLEGASFIGADLSEANLQNANLANTNFTNANLNKANLKRANLSKAKLIQSQLDETDLTGANLTGATIEDWGITSRTKLHEVRCKYVFMRSSTEDDPNPCRKPDNWKQTFDDGDFADFIKPIIDTLDLYHNQGVDPRAIAISFKQLAENHPEAELRIVGMEVRGKDKFLLRAKTAVTADKSELSAEYFDTYNEIKSLPEREIKLLLSEKDNRIRSLETMVMTALQRPTYYSNVEQVGNMTNNPGGFSVGGSVGGDIRNVQGDNNKVVQGDGNMTGDRNINTDGGNYNERIQGDYVQGNYYAAGQPQSLAEAAAEIQLLLKQLEQTYPTTTTSQQMVVAAEAISRIESNPSLKKRAINAAKEGGLAALEKAIDNPAGAFIVGAIKGWQEVEAED